MLNDILSFFEFNKVGWLHDFADRMNSGFTVYILILFSSLVTYKTYFISSISCFVSTSPNGLNFGDFLTNFCWVNGTINLLDKEEIPIDSEWDNYKHRIISYYPWMPIILIIQCILFYMPKVIWKEYCVSKAGIDLESIINSSIKASEMPSGSRSDSIKDIAGIIESLFKLQRHIGNGTISNIKRKLSQRCPFFVWDKRSGNSMFGVYMAIKPMYIANAVGQCFLMMKVLHLQSFFDIIEFLVFGYQSSATKYFPRITYCNVQGVRSLGAFNNRYVAQCVLPINIFNEKIYIFLFIWISFLIALNIFYFFKWIYLMLFNCPKRSFVKMYLKGRNVLKKTEESLIDEFIEDFLRLDGMFLLKIIKINAGDLITADIMEQLWNVYNINYKNLEVTGGGNFENEGNRFKELYVPKMDTFL